MSNIDDELKEMDIAKLRKFAAASRVAIARDMNKEDIIEAIKAKNKDKDILRVGEVGTEPLPGFARIIMHRDPTPGAQNRPVYVQVNGYKCTVPRGIEVDVPLKVVNVLNDAKEMRKVEDPSEPVNSPKRFANQAVHSYPFQTISFTPGPDPRPGLEKTKMAKYGPRLDYNEKFGRWPTRAELDQAIKDGLVQTKRPSPKDNVDKE